MRTPIIPTGYAPGGVTYIRPRPRRLPPRQRMPPMTVSRGPAAPRPYAAMSEVDLQAEAARQAANSIASQGAPIETARSRAAQQALNDIKAITGIGAAGAELMKGIGPGIQAGYSQAAKETGALAGGFSGEMANRVRAGEESNAAFAASQGAAAPGGVPNPTDMQDVAYGLGGFIPGASLETQGAAANRWGEVLPGIEQIRTEQGVQGRQAEAIQSDKEYEQQLIDLATKEPELRDQVIDKLWQHEMDKLTARQNISAQNLEGKKFAEEKRHTRVEERQSGRQIGVQERAQDLYEDQFGETRRHNVVTEAQDWKNLKLTDARQQADLQKAASEGSQPDASLSKVYGFIVDSNGVPILDAAGKRIPIKTKATAKDKKDVYGKAVEQARSLRGNPVESNNPNAPGTYVARKGAPGIFKGNAALGVPNTTNDPKKAAYDTDMSFAEAQSFLMNRYGLNRARARAALIASGWKPDGKRPKKPEKAGPPAPGRDTAGPYP